MNLVHHNSIYNLYTRLTLVLYEWVGCCGKLLKGTFRKKKKRTPLLSAVGRQTIERKWAG